MMSVHFLLMTEKLMDGNAKEIHFFVQKEKEGELWFWIFF